jgi:broad specificity phosphatase PhoE
MSSEKRNEVVLVRHGETPWSEEGRFAGRTDLPLTPNGEALALELGPRLVHYGFDRVMTSPLFRAKRTAELFNLGPVDIDDRLVERDYGAYEGLTTAEIRAKDPVWNVWKDAVPNGEDIEDMTARVDSFIGDLRAGGSKRTLVAAHGHFIRLFTARWLGLDTEYARLFRIGTLGVVHLGWERENPVMHKWNA